MERTDATYKPEASTSTSDGGSSGGKNVSGQSLNNELRMTLEEAQLILNVKKEESMERVLEVSKQISSACSPCLVTCNTRGVYCADPMLNITDTGW